MEITLTVTQQELDIIGMWLWKLPYEQSAQLIWKLSEQWMKIQEENNKKQVKIEKDLSWVK